MKLVFKPKSGEPEQEWVIDGDDMTIGEAKVLEKVTGLTMAEVGQHMERGSFTVMMTFLWLFRKREEPSLRLTDLDDIRVSELSVVADEDDEEEPAVDDGPKGSSLSAVS